ncbi:hypothetical protein AB0G04_00245 [Actinoplanes sp. NPDC023801]|uniref:hypothetical protein n=1 Tax=Actinoplanes sp. NPDC023801 TaxID=3154595 RepID=UPI0033C44F5A
MIFYGTLPNSDVESQPIQQEDALVALTDGVWIATTDGLFIRADTVTVLDVVDGNYSRQKEGQPGHQAGLLSIRGLTSPGAAPDTTWHEFAGDIRDRGEAFTALRGLIGTLQHTTGKSVIISYDAATNGWTEDVV